MGTFHLGPPEEILQLLTNFYKELVVTVNSYTIGKIEYLSTLLKVEVLQEYYLTITVFWGMIVSNLQGKREF